MHKTLNDSDRNAIALHSVTALPLTAPQHTAHAVHKLIATKTSSNHNTERHFALLKWAQAVWMSACDVWRTRKWSRGCKRQDFRRQRRAASNIATHANTRQLWSMCWLAWAAMQPKLFTAGEQKGRRGRQSAMVCHFVRSNYAANSGSLAWCAGSA